ncbi:MAG TPA: MFS transporter, partial [Hellea balneolensis]|nr:MFS transporter [Hellea balneolensis]
MTDNTQTQAIPPQGKWFAFHLVKLEPGVTRWNARTYFYSAFWTIAFLSFLSLIQNYVLRVHLNLPDSEIGRAVGNLSFFGEMVFLLVSPYLGALSDKIGRRPIWALGFVWIGVGFALYPLASSYSMLVVIRALMGVGAAALGGMMATVLSDYPQNHTRGKMGALSGWCNGLGAMTGVFLLAKLPNIYAAKGVAEAEAGTYTFWTITALAFLTAAIVFVGLKKGKPGKTLARKPVPELMKEGFGAAKVNPRLRLAFAESFIARGDLLMIGTFLSAWLFHAGIDAHGMSRPEAMANAGRYGGIVQMSTLLWAPFFGFILDKFDRVSTVIFAMGMASIGYISVGLTDDIMSKQAVIPLVLLGIGEFSAIMAGQTLVAQEAPIDVRGSVLGVFAFCGALGLLILSKVGGHIFDSIGPGAP